MLPIKFLQITKEKTLFLVALIVAGAVAAPLTVVSNTTEGTSTAELLTSTWTLTSQNGASEKYQSINPQALKGKDTLRLTYNLHGLCALSGDASAIIFDQPIGRDWRYVSLANYGKNCFDGVQTVDIPLSDFKGLDLNKEVGTFHTRFWYDKPYTVEILSAAVLNTQNSGTQLTPTPTPTITQPTPQPQIGFNAKYWNTPNSGSKPSIPTTAPTVSREDEKIDFTWNHMSPDARINWDHFVAEWTKQQQFEQATYRFTTVSDDGIRVMVDGKPVIDQWNDHPRTTHTADIYLDAGIHELKVQFYENTGDAIAKLFFEKVTDTQQPTPRPTVPPTDGRTWAIQSVSSMKESKDRVCGQRSQDFINRWVDKAKELGVTHIAVETPYDNPSCASAHSYTKMWVEAIRSRGLKVWHRHMPLAFEGIYDTPKRTDGSDYLNMISSYIRNNPSFFEEGDIFTPIPEPQNGGIAGISYCSYGVCQFTGIADFNAWLRNAIDVSENAFSQIGLGGKIKIGYYGFDGFIAWGSNNPDWNGILEDATVAKMGNITVDHYPELIGDTMENGLNELQARYPGVPIIIGEWGSASSGNLEQQVINSMGAAKRPGVVGFNYWHMGMGGNEALINEDFSHRPQFDEVQLFFKGVR